MKRNLYKKASVLGVIILFIGTSAVSSISLNIENSNNIKDNNKIPVIYNLNNEKEMRSLPLLHKNGGDLLKTTQFLDNQLIFSYEMDQSHPAFGRTDSGVIMAGYYDEDFDEIMWTGSDDDGEYFIPETFWTVGGDKPSIEHWGDTTFYGTYVSDPDDYNGGIINLFECTDPTDDSTYGLPFWDWWSDDGLHDMIDAEIACDNSQEDWEWGFISFIASKTNSEEYTNGPFITYQVTDGGAATLSWYTGYAGCAHTDADIDHVTFNTYAVYDWYNSTAWLLLLRIDDFSNWNDPGTLYEIIGDGNLQYPVVAAYNNNLVVLAETDENGNKDIICFYSDSGASNIEASFVIETNDDERYPDVRHVEGDDFICTFVKNNNLYASKTEDGGATWSTPRQINDNEGSVAEKYKTSDLCEKGVNVMWEDERGADKDIYMESINFNNPPEFSNENPSDNSTDIPITTSSLSVYIEDPEGNLFDWSIETRPDIGSSSDFDDSDGTKTCSISGLDKGVTYTWFVNATDPDDSGQTTEEIYTFTTESNDPPGFSEETPSNGSNEVEITTSSLSVVIEDPEGDLFDWSIETSPDIGSNTGTHASNGIKTCSISGLEFDTTYTWYVNASDPGGSGQTTGEVYTFTVEINDPPGFSNENPSDGSNDIPLTTSSLSVVIEDDEGDGFEWSIETSPDIGSNSSTHESNGIKTCSISGLEFDTTYTWYVNASDPGGSGQTTEEVYTFTVEINDPPGFSNENPRNNSPTIPITLSTLEVNISDDEGDNFNWSIETSPDIGSNNSSDDTDGVKTCNISGLDYGMTYTWFVNASDPDGSGQTTKTIYTFTTQPTANSPPFVPSNPSPYNGESNVFLNAIMSWTGGDPDPGDMVTYDVYFSKNSPPEKVKSNQTEDVYYEGTLDPNTKYYWRIVAWDSQNLSTSSSIWNFTTQLHNLPPKINIVKPEKAFYLFNDLILQRPLRNALVIGDLTIEVNATDTDDGIERLEFFIDNILVNTSKKPNANGLYTYLWTRDRFRFIHMRRIKIRAYDHLGQEDIVRLTVKRIL